MFRRTGRPLATPLSAQIAKVCRSVDYLRQCPPHLYVTCDGEAAADGQPLRRHTTQLLDTGKDKNSTPQTEGVYVLSSTDVADLSFEDAKALRRTLVGLPSCRNRTDAKDFVARHAEQLQSLRTIALTEVTPGSSGVLQALVEAFPQARVVCSDFGRFLFTDPTFFSGVKKVVCENEVGAVAPSDFIFPELSADLFVVPEEGQPIPLDLHPSGRSLHCSYVRRAAASHKGRPKHFVEEPLFYFDSVLESMHVGRALLRLPWLPLFAAEASYSRVLPTASLLATKHNATNTTLLEPWRVLEEGMAIAATLRQHPFTQRVLSSNYGELRGDVEDVAAAVEDGARALEGLRSRLARRLELDTARDMDHWSPLLLRRVVREVLLTEAAPEPLAEEQVGELAQWAQEGPLGTVAAALTRAALSLPPSKEHLPPPRQQAPGYDGTSGSPAADAGRNWEATLEENRAELEGAEGVQLLRTIFEKKGLKGIAHILEKENIDLGVFLAMTDTDFRSVFKATFGIAKKLQALQRELKANLK